MLVVNAAAISTIHGYLDQNGPGTIWSNTGIVPEARGVHEETDPTRQIYEAAHMGAEVSSTPLKF